MIYSPQRVMRQLGYGKNVIIQMEELVTSSALTIEVRIVGQGRDQTLGFSSLYRLCQSKVNGGSTFLANMRWADK